MKQRYLTFLKIWNKLTEDYEKDEQFIENSNRELRRSKVQNKVKLKKRVLHQIAMFWKLHLSRNMLSKLS